MKDGGKRYDSYPQLRIHVMYPHRGVRFNVQVSPNCDSPISFYYHNMELLLWIGHQSCPVWLRSLPDNGHIKQSVKPAISFYLIAHFTFSFHCIFMQMNDSVRILCLWTFELNFMKLVSVVYGLFVFWLPVCASCLYDITLQCVCGMFSTMFTAPVLFSVNILVWYIFLGVLGSCVSLVFISAVH